MDTAEYIKLNNRIEQMSSSGGHTIENASGTALTQRDTLQFKGGLSVSDDSTNEVTVVDDTVPEIEWSVWNAMTPQEQEAIPNAIILNAPDTGGGDTSACANKTDISSIILTGTTNTSGSTIYANTWFYLNGELVRAKVDIANNATFTLGTNYEKKTMSEEMVERGMKFGCHEISPNTYTNANDVPYGITQYCSQGQVSNMPPNVSGMIFTLLAYRQFQLFIDYEGLNIYFRAYNVNTQRWSIWKQISYTNVS